jgi:hypothetical protein
MPDVTDLAEWPETRAFLSKLGNYIYYGSDNSWHTLTVHLRAKQDDRVDVDCISLVPGSPIPPPQGDY